MCLQNKLSRFLKTDLLGVYIRTSRTQFFQKTLCLPNSTKRTIPFSLLFYAFCNNIQPPALPYATCVVRKHMNIPSSIGGVTSVQIFGGAPDSQRNTHFAGSWNSLHSFQEPAKWVFRWLSGAPPKIRTEGDSPYTTSESTPRNRNRTSCPPGPSPPLNLYSPETLTNWRNASTCIFPGLWLWKLKPLHICNLPGESGTPGAVSLKTP